MSKAEAESLLRDTQNVREGVVRGVITGAASAASVPAGVAIGAGYLAHRAAQNRAQEIYDQRHLMEDEVARRLKEAGLLSETVSPKTVNDYYGQGMMRLAGDVIGYEGWQRAGATLSREFLDKSRADATAKELVKIYATAAKLAPGEAAELVTMFMEGSVPEQAVAQAVAATEVRLNRLTTDMEIQRHVAAGLADARVDAWQRVKGEVKPVQLGEQLVRSIDAGREIKSLYEKGRLLSQDGALEVDPNTLNPQQARAYKLFQDIGRFRELQSQFIENDNDQTADDRTEYIGLLLNDEITNCVLLDAYEDGHLTPEEKAAISAYESRKNSMQERASYEFVIEQTEDVDRIFNTPLDELDFDDRQELDRYIDEAKKQVTKHWRVRLKLSQNEIDAYDMQVAETARELALIDRLTGKYHLEKAESLEEGQNSLMQLALQVQSVLQMPNAEQMLRENDLLDTYLDESLAYAEDKMLEAEEQYFEELRALHGQTNEVSDADRQAVIQGIGPEFAYALKSQSGVAKVLDLIAQGHEDEAYQYLEGQVTSVNHRIEELQDDQALYDRVATKSHGRGNQRREVPVSESKILQDHPQLRELIELRRNQREYQRILNAQGADRVTTLTAYFRQMEERNAEVIAQYQPQYEAELEKIRTRYTPKSSDEIAKEIGGTYFTAYTRLNHIRNVREAILSVDDGNDFQQHASSLEMASYHDIIRSSHDAGSLRKKSVELSSRSDTVALEYVTNARNRLGAIKEGQFSSVEEIHLEREEQMSALFDSVNKLSTNAEQTLFAAKRAYNTHTAEVRDMRNEFISLRTVVADGRESVKAMYGENVYDRMKVAHADIQRAAAEEARLEMLMEKVQSGEHVKLGNAEQTALNGYMDKKKAEAMQEQKTMEAKGKEERLRYAHDMASSLGIDTESLPDGSLDKMVEDTEGMGFFAFLLQLIATLFSQGR